MINKFILFLSSENRQKGKNMKKTMKLFVSAATFAVCSASYATTQTDTANAANALVTANQIHSELQRAIANNINAIETQAINTDLTTLIAQAQLESELNQFIEQAKSELPSNRFRVVFAD